MSFNGKRLFRKRNGMLFGICLGVADYLEVDVTVIRLLWIIAGCMGIGVIAYVAAAFVMPLE
jgi:phage shock protein C